MKKVLVFLFVMLVAFCVTMMFSDHPNIVGLGNYPHAVAIIDCDGEDAPVMVQEGEFVMWKADGVMYTVNWGHMLDSEVALLQQAAEKQAKVYCNK